MCPSCDHSLDDHSPKRGCSKCLCDVKPDVPAHPREDPNPGPGTDPGLQRSVLALVEEAEAWGVTWHDVARSLGLHHGRATSALSHLHNRGAVVRLADERRHRCSVYVLPGAAGGRGVASQGWRGLHLKPHEVKAFEQVFDVAFVPADVTKVVRAALDRAAW